MIDKAAVGKRIALLRKQLDYSQAVYAEKLNVSTQAVSKWETGRSLPDIEVLLRISWISNVSLHALLGGEDFMEPLAGMDRGMLCIAKHLVCPHCQQKLKMHPPVKQEKQHFTCDSGHRFDVIDGVLHFGSREIAGELWSLYFKNYEHYLQEQRQPGNPRYLQGEPNDKELIWRKIEALRPRVILDMACGTGRGIKYIIERVNWPVTIVMADLSHRILKWNRIFYSEEWKNPYVDIVYLACDCASLPLADNCVDVVFSYGGFESMQRKMMDGFFEGFRVLKPGGHAVYNMSVVEDQNSENSQRWIGLIGNQFSSQEKMQDINQWLSKCEKAGYQNNDAIKVYGELPAPKEDRFPFENEILQWMAAYVMVSQK